MLFRASPRMAGPAAVQPLVLVVEDEPQMRHFLVSTLATNGFRSLHVGTPVGMLTRAVAHEPDLILLDLSQPGIDTVDLTVRLRERTSAPILVVLAGGAERERVAVLDAGANDYLVRPFGTGDLLARMRVWLRQAQRARRASAPPELPTEPFRLERERRSLFVEGREVHITPLEYKLLAALARSPGTPMSEDRIVAAVWGAGAPSQRQYLRAHVRQLRQKIEKDPARPRHLITDSEGGYRLKLS
jgi:two-component system KDP operon response regulator KdpE